MKTLDIDSNKAAHRAAEVALHEKIQEVFNLRPAPLVNLIRKVAEKKHTNPGIIALEWYPSAQALFAEFITRVEVIVRNNVQIGQTRRYSDLEWDLIKHFNLRPAEIAEGIRESAAREGYDPTEAVTYARQHVSDVVCWTFEEVIRILSKPE